MYPVFKILNFYIGSIVFFLMLTQTLSAQNVVVKLEADATSDPKQKCCTIWVENESPQAVTLAGQNYRLYYDSDGMLLNEGSVKTLLPATYEPIKLVQHYFDVDASGFGVLPFESHLGFINLATDHNLVSGGALLLVKGKPLPVASFCFHVNEGKESTVIWAQDNLTHTYATAFVEIAVNDGQEMKKSNISKYIIDQDGIQNVQQPLVLDTEIFPNPFTDKLTINFNHPLQKDAVLKITDIFGKVIKTSVVDKGSVEAHVSGDDLPYGAFMIHIKTEDGNTSSMKAIHIK